MRARFEGNLVGHHLRRHRVRRRRWVSCTLALSLWATAGWSSPVGAAPRRVAIALGNNVGRAGTAPLSFAVADARRMAAVLREMGRFDTVEVLAGVRVSGAVQALRRMAHRVQRWRRQGDSVLFLFYYSGHADRAGLQLGPTLLTREALLAELTAVNAQTTIAVLDACHSGSLGQTRSKGLRATAAQRPHRVHQIETKGRVIIASGAPGEQAQESEQLQGSFFTAHLVSGLRGAADRNRDGVVHLDEAYAYAYHRTVGSTVTSMVGIQHPTRAVELRGRRGVALTWPGRSTCGLKFRARESGAFVVLSADERLVFAEISAQPDRPIAIGLRPGRYVVRKRAAEGVHTRQVTLRRGDQLELDEAKMQRRPYAALVNKPARRVGWLAVTGGLNSDVVGAGLHPSVGLGYVFDLGPVALWPSVELGIGGDDSGDLDTSVAVLESSLAVVRPFWLPVVGAFVGARVVVPLIWQRIERVGTQTSAGIGFDGVVGVTRWITRYLGVLLQLHAGVRGLQLADSHHSEQTRFGWRFAAGGRLGLRLRF